ncbi:aspartic proteinase Asp1-like [Amaranthus tricolor]|uniref:aspartic proteinase Asp1-like n=1 Tax=Amaranthus tricolor TaxID=29722 RepID=UPI00258DEDF7|nr:aspartic proteinase Asp1-like [Amaranthus tricolor]XP_057517035.1 aspartic proteinase Asp1-like [Amaranthus tricolor]
MRRLWATKEVAFSLIQLFLFSAAAFLQGSLCEPQNSQNRRGIHNLDYNAVFRVQGNVYPDGYFYTTLNIGEPPKPYHLDIDTGSDLTWVHCDAPCINCPKSPHDPYKPANNALSCHDSLCTFLQHPPNYPCHNPSDQCDYEIEYADHGSSIGVLVKDFFRLQVLNGFVARASLAFGCGYDQDISGSPPFVDGVLGLANGKSSLLSQLHELKVMKNVFGHCLSVQGGGYLFFGDKLVSKDTVWVPMLKQQIENYYSIGPADLLFNGKNVVKNGLSFVLDSGSTYTYLNSPVYEAALSMIKKNVDSKKLKVVHEDKTLPVCWKGIEPFKSINDVQMFFKPLALKFSKVKNAVIEMSPEAYLVINQFGNVCLGILDGGEAGLEDINILGDISLLNKMMIYDNDNSRIGWATAKCDMLPNFDQDQDTDTHLYRVERDYDEL